MGFSVTASHVVFFVAFLSVGSLAATAWWKSTTDIEEARRVESERLADIVHTNITIVGTPTYDAANLRYTFQVQNAGSTVLDMSGFVILLDGTVNLSIENMTIAGVASTRYLIPGETMTVNMRPVLAAPSDLKVTAGNGVSAYHRS